ncbi:unnamed protein product [Cylindrotheca closterium]|uniref:Uncharacterized protein n=1 Tax=Cylindrotheca closterium TaxID=2856 RepID=A0AAD2FYU6_9STRA|nr:unnamed protein product [Cylindrotheca closterium]
MSYCQQQSSAGIAAPAKRTSLSQYWSHGSSMISSITLDDCLFTSDERPPQNRGPNPKLRSLMENKWAAMPSIKDTLRLPRRNLNRFSNMLEETETAMCPPPQRQTSADTYLSSSSLNYRASMTDSSGSSKHFGGQSSSFLKEESLCDEDLKEDEREEDDTSSESFVEPLE